MAVIKIFCRICGQSLGEKNCPIPEAGVTDVSICQNCFEENLRRFNLAPPTPQAPQKEQS